MLTGQERRPWWTQQSLGTGTEADEQETMSPQVLRDPYILRGASL